MGLIVSFLALRDREKFYLSVLSLFLALAFPPPQTPAQSATPAATPQPVQLLPGRETVREIGGGQKHSYSISMTAGAYASVAVQQRGIDLSIRLFGSDGKPIFEFDAETRPTGAEKVDIVSTLPETFRLDVETKAKDLAANNYAITWEEIRPATDRDRSLDEARRLATESRTLDRAAKYTDAIAKTEKAIEILTTTLGANDRSVGIMTNRLGILYYSLGDNARSETYLRQALAIYESQPIRDELLVAEPLNNLAVLQRLKGDFVEAEKLWLRVVAIRTRELGEDHPTIAANLNNLGILYRRRGDYAKAEEVYSRALAIRERSLGRDHLDVAIVLTNLAALNYYKGDFEAALAIDLRTLSIRESKLGPDHPEVAQGRTSLAATFVEIGELEKADQLYRQAIQSFEKNATQNPPGLAAAEYGLGDLYRERGDYTSARRHYARAIEMAEKSLTTDPLRLSDYLSGFARMLTMEGSYPEAEATLNRVLEIRERILGPEHPHVGSTCDALARLYSVNGDFAKSLLFQTRANAINEDHIARTLIVGTEHQRIAFMTQMSHGMQQTLDLHVLKAAASAAARDLAFTAVLNRKGRVLDAVANGRAGVKRRLDPESQLLMQRANDARSRLAESALAGPVKGDVGGFQKQLASMKENMDSLDKEVSRRTAGQYEVPATVNISSISADLPRGSALIEFSVFQPIPKGRSDGKNVDGEARYVAYVLTNNGTVKWADLGVAKQIDETIQRFRNALRDPKQKNVHVEARNLDQKIMQPVRALAGDSTHFLISPDGNLSHTPFEALVDEDNRFLVERFAFTYLSSGRELLRMKLKRESVSPPLIVANPSFGDSASGTGVVLAADPSKATRRSITSGRSLSDTYFAPLAGTGAEARSIQILFSDARVLSGNAATESAIKRADAPRLLHIATHGFFLQNPPDSSLRAGSNSYRGGMPTNTVENPLLRSGLAFSGANRRSDGTDDGILTALEASGLNLWGTKLVVLSACDTGVGEVRNGEGVYGLRRSFQIAGAESLVMSLWPISDLVTRELMTGYYTNLKKGIGRGESLRKVQLDMLKRPNRRHPFYWASFIQSGEWANLDGKR